MAWPSGGNSQPVCAMRWAAALLGLALALPSPAATAPGDDDATYETLLAAERGAAAARTQSRADSAARHKEAIARRLAKRRRGSFG